MMTPITTTTTTQPQKQKKKAICASLTAKGRPCKALSSAHWTPFCHTHTPYEPVEFVGGGPLDGLSFGNSFAYLVRQDEIIVVRTDEGRVVVIGAGIGTVVKRCTRIGTYREEFHGLVLVWRWHQAS